MPVGMVSQQTFGPVPGAPLLLGQSRGRPARAPWAGRQGAAPSRIQWGQMAGTGQHRSPTVLCLCAQPHAHTHRHEHESHPHLPCVTRPSPTHTSTRPSRPHTTRPPRGQPQDDPTHHCHPWWLGAPGRAKEGRKCCPQLSGALNDYVKWQAIY